MKLSEVTFIMTSEHASEECAGEAEMVGVRKEEVIAMSPCLYNPARMVMFVSSLDRRTVEWEGRDQRLSPLTCQPPCPKGQISLAGLVFLSAI